jgi:malonyl-CoA decarboxylase
MLDAQRQPSLKSTSERALRLAVSGCKRLLSERGASNSQSIARGLVERINELEGWQLDAFFEYLAADLSPDPQAVLLRAQAYAEQRNASSLIELLQTAEPARQELLRRLNRTPGGTGCIMRLRRELLLRLKQSPQLMSLEADLLHLLSSWFNPGFLKMERVDWNSPAQLLEKIIHHEAVHEIDGWNDLRRRLQPDRRCFAFFHPQLPGEPLIFVEVALLPDMPGAIAPLIDKSSEPSGAERFRVAAFYSISNCEPGLRGVSLGNFLIKSVAEQLRRELPRLKTFCTLSPIPGFAAWFLSDPDLSALPGLRKPVWDKLAAARELLHTAVAGQWATLPQAVGKDLLGAEQQAALMAWAAAYLTWASPTAGGDPVARFHLDNGARLERLNWRGNLAVKGLKQSFGLMVNYLYDLEKVETSHEKFKQGEVARSRAVQVLM